MTNWAPALDAYRGPRYQAIADALADDIAGGSLKPGDRLPTHRDLAWRLKVTVGTVSRAYAEAERRGLTLGEVGRGTFVQGADLRKNPVLNTADQAEPGMLHLDHAAPVPTVIDHRILDTLQDIAAARSSLELMGYQPPNGQPAQRAAAADWLSQRGVTFSPAQITLTAGAQHGLGVALAALTQPGDRVLCEGLTYPGIQPVARLLGLRLIGLASDDGGLRPDAVEAACRSQDAKALYCVPTLQNPTTATLSQARRRQIAEIAARHDLPIVEDDVFGHLAIDPPPPLAAFAPERTYFVTSLSKTLAPGLRIGFIAAPAGTAQQLGSAVRAQSWMVPALNAEIGARMIRDGSAAEILAARQQEAAARRALALEILGAYEIACPPGAIHLWLTLPEPWRAGDFTAAALQRKIKVTPADAFAVDRRETPHAVRLCFGPAESRDALKTGLCEIDTLLRDGPGGSVEAVV